MITPPPVLPYLAGTPLVITVTSCVMGPETVSAVRGIRIKPAEVPATVMKAIPEHAPSAEVAYITLESWSGRAVYIVTFKDDAHNPRLLVASDGSIVEETP